MIPENIEKYSSLEIQQIIVEFIEAFYKWKQDIDLRTKDISNKLDLLDSSILALAFRE